MQVQSQPGAALIACVCTLAISACDRIEAGDPCVPGSTPIVVDRGGCTSGSGPCLLSCTGSPGCEDDAGFAWTFSYNGPTTLVCGCDGADHYSPNADYGGPPNVPFRWFGSCADPCGALFYSDSGRWEQTAPYPPPPFCSDCATAVPGPDGCLGSDGMPRAAQCCECHYEGERCLSIDGTEMASAECCEARCTVAPCYSGPAGTSGVGSCRRGVSRCDRACTDEVLPVIEVAGDGLDQDCDGSVDEGPELDSHRPSIAFDGEGYAAVWSEGSGRMAFARFDSDGARIDYAEPLAIAEGIVQSTGPQLAWSGAHFGVLAGTFQYRDPSPSVRELLFARLDRGGRVMEEHRLPVDSSCDGTRLRWGGGRFYRLMGSALFVAPDGEPPAMIAVPEIRVLARCAQQDAVWNGDGYGAVWVQSVGAGDHELRFARLNIDGAVVPGSQRTIAPIAPAGCQLEWTGTGYVVLAGDGRELFELDETGVVLRQRTIEAPESARATSLVRLGDGTAIYAWVIDGEAQGVQVVAEDRLASYTLTLGSEVGEESVQLATGSAGEVGIALTRCSLDRCEVFFVRATTDGLAVGPVQVSND